MRYSEHLGSCKTYNRDRNGLCCRFTTNLFSVGYLTKDTNKSPNSNCLLTNEINYTTCNNIMEFNSRK